MDIIAVPSPQAEQPADETNESLARDLERFAGMADWLDTRFGIPSIPLRVGLDGILGLIPGVGDTVTAGMGLYALGLARKHGAPKRAQIAIVRNTAIDWLVGSIPLVGDLFDFAFKAHAKNSKVLHKHLA